MYACGQRRLIVRPLQRQSISINRKHRSPHLGFKSLYRQAFISFHRQFASSLATENWYYKEIAIYFKSIINILFIIQIKSWDCVHQRLTKTPHCHVSYTLMVASTHSVGRGSPTQCVQWLLHQYPMVKCRKVK